MLILNKNILTIGGNRLEGGPLTPPTPPTPTFDEITIRNPSYGSTESQTWTKYNLSINDGGEGIYSVDNVTANGLNMGTQYYYTPEAAIRVVNSIQGWHLPTQSECSTMITWVMRDSCI